MAGSWTCTYHGTNANGPADHPKYRFFGGGLWLEESSDYRQGGQDYSSTQIWGFDPRAKRLVAYQFTAGGVATKTVDGWVNGLFVSHRDDDHSTVSIVPKGAKAFDWLIVSADHNTTIREECKR